jgi:hypothetical protein
MNSYKYPIEEHVYAILNDSKYKIGYTKNLKKILEVYNTGKAKVILKMNKLNVNTSIEKFVVQ